MHRPQVARLFRRILEEYSVPMLDQMTSNRDRRIWAIARGGDLKLDDSNTPEPVDAGRIWIEGVLDRDLAQVTRVELGLAEQPDAVDHPWGALLVQPGQPEQALPPGTRISALAGRFDRQLLILGGPGAGKTTLLLEYARDLLEQASGDGSAPTPVVFHLSG